MSQATRPRICDKKYKTAEQKILKVLNKIDNLKLNNAYVSQIVCPGKGTEFSFEVLHYLTKFYKVFMSVVVFVGVMGAWWTFKEFSFRSCILHVPSALKPLFRPPEDCSMCAGVSGVARVTNITPYEFEEQFAYKATPVIVTDGMTGWRAVEEFNFKFFADFYRNGKMGKRINDCFFFPYKSGLNSLEEVFTMEEGRANLSGQPWYVGWSTCYDEETRKLRGYYNRPYFLPKTAESDMVDWIFMGGPGQGAHMHVDSVRHMSWQGQVRGRKSWELAPPPECLYRCQRISFTVEPGEILVVDTNRWYHKTNVQPGELSITIGAEYD